MIELVLRLGAVADPLQRQAVVGQRVAHQREVLARVEVAGAGVNRLDEVGGDDVEAVASVSDRKLRPSSTRRRDVGPREQVVVDVLEERGALAHAVGELDDEHVGVVLADRAGRGAAAQADDQRALRVRVQHHRQVADQAVQPHHLRRVGGLVQPVEVHQPAAEGVGVDADRGLHAFLPPEDALAAAVPAGQRGLERIGHDAARWRRRARRAATAASRRRVARTAATLAAR